MQGPRADFRCKKCNEVYENLPVSCQRCPVCNAKRGFEMIFTSLNIGSGMAQKVERQLNLDNAMKNHEAIKESARNYVQSQNTMVDLIEHKGSPEQKKGLDKLKGLVNGSMAAKGALGMVDSDMRQISRERLYPSLKLHKVVPRGLHG